MGIDKGWMAGSTAMLLLRLLEERDRYGYQIYRGAPPPLRPYV